MLLVVAVLGAAVVFLALEHWRLGTFLLGGAALLGAALRLVVPTERAGLLAVRGKVFDVAWLTVLSGAIIVLAATINSLGVT
ncbi:DUF3017 domain-containing protein [Nocardia yunnanensis]|uniref:DUF3017 domain-containing protein n=1 Tax=Nocardia yunnanensis TaxID=2382165 RepID=A0A386ZBU3_9NOCA|nr:DUF3017 domain-containing protein [Nocardia yunnanensis]AYF75090.1 DUF3017 domain-containing protein [Nocardia yunnanensis]